jgi:glycosyltransferase involved in cell wall biosynthesis
MPFNEENILLSIMIISIPSRIDQLKKLITKLENQISKVRSESVEILCFIDNKSKHIAEKRNDVLESARGKFICCLDDDDDVSDDYISSLVSAILENSDVDVITFNQHCMINGEPMKVSFGMNNPVEPLSRSFDGTLNNILRPPFHMCLWNSKISKSEEFKPVYINGQSSEDFDWVSRLYPKVKTEFKIEKELHYYIYNSKTTESILN